MGGTFGKDFYNATLYANTTTSTRAARATSADDVYTSNIKEELLPKNIKKNRESCDFDGKETVPVILGCDVTASMNSILLDLVKTQLPKVAKELFERRPIEHLNLCFMAIGDCHAFDRYPLQITQFEGDERIVDALGDLYLEGGGGGNNSEAYPLAWHFASNHVNSDHIKKRNKKGYLITFGDDGCPRQLTSAGLEKVYGKPMEAVDVNDLLAQTQREWEIFHVTFKQGYTADERTKKSWDDMLNERHIILDDYTKLGELIVSLIQMNEQSMSVEEILETWDGSTAVTLKSALPIIKSQKNSKKVKVF